VQDNRGVSDVVWTSWRERWESILILCEELSAWTAGHPVVRYVSWGGHSGLIAARPCVRPPLKALPGTHHGRHITVTVSAVLHAAPWGDKGRFRKRNQLSVEYTPFYDTLRQIPCEAVGHEFSYFSIETLIRIFQTYTCNRNREFFIDVLYLSVSQHVSAPTGHPQVNTLYHFIFKTSSRKP
jgi:hypothetical protein